MAASVGQAFSKHVWANEPGFDIHSEYNMLDAKLMRTMLMVKLGPLVKKKLNTGMDTYKVADPPIVASTIPSLILTGFLTPSSGAKV
eukprot:2599861-Amphidinium_carterae.1